jgi:hypothetical protein
MNPHSYAYPIFDKGAKNIRQRNLQQMLLGNMVSCLLKTETRSMFITLY